jgi:broad-specificity NMP kinase
MRNIMLKVIAIGGMPGTGKTAVMNAILAELETGKLFGYKTCKGIKFESGIIILGVYDGNTFSGTDRLSMSVQPDAKQLFNHLVESGEYDDWLVLYEGDRLFNNSMFAWLIAMDVDLEIILLKSKEDELEKRYKKRGSNQGESWLKGRRTKYTTLETIWEMTIFDNDNFEDQKQIVKNILKPYKHSETS